MFVLKKIVSYTRPQKLLPLNEAPYRLFTFTAKQSLFLPTIVRCLKKCDGERGSGRGFTPATIGSRKK